MKLFKLVILALSILCLPVINCQADTNNIPMTVCFTPGGDCTNDIVNAIQKTHKNILVQAYQFTSPPIAKAIIDAKRRGVDVKIILDKSQYNAKKYSSALFFEHEDIPVWIDYKVNIAHNKVMVIDNETVITGSFNFTKNAQEHNAENLLIIKNPALAKIYTQNWYKRLAASVTLDSYKTMRRSNHLKGERAKHHRGSQNPFKKFEKSLNNL